MNTRRSHRRGEAAGDPADSGPTSTTIPNERSREEFLEEIGRLEAGNRELRHERRQTLERAVQELREEQARLKEGPSTQRAEGKTDDLAQSDVPWLTRHRRRGFTPLSSSGSRGNRPAKRSRADRAKQVALLREYHCNNWAEYYSYTNRIELNCEYKPSIVSTERDKALTARQQADQTTDDFATYLDQLEEELEPYKESHRKQHLLTKFRPELKQAIKAYATQLETRYELVLLARDWNKISLSASRATLGLPKANSRC
ncbi:MAG: hypothetical protein M1816_004009 [Peltula sp. TS41687]|nr:MAG: hypothetical protein M1816_004009 [Peltula sp. TS41687]